MSMYDPDDYDDPYYEPTYEQKRISELEAKLALYEEVLVKDTTDTIFRRLESNTAGISKIDSSTILYTDSKGYRFNLTITSLGPTSGK